jgi:hypothetical protein
MARLSRVYHYEYWVPGPRPQRILCTEYWFPLGDTLDSDRVDGDAHDRAERELRSYLQTKRQPGTSQFMDGGSQWYVFTYDWDRKKYIGGFVGLPEPDEIMRPPDDPRLDGDTGAGVPRTPRPGSRSGGAEATLSEEPTRRLDQ